MSPDHYTIIEELIWNESFRRWVLHPTTESDQYWRSWSASNPDKSPAINQARAVVKALTVRDRAISEQTIRELVEETIAIAQTDTNEPMVIRPLWYQSWLVRAASVALFLGLGWFGYQQYIDSTRPLTYQKLTKSVPTKLVERINETDSDQLVRLSDGSTITLRPRARVSYPSAFAATQRDLYLTGEAFFDVARDPNRPFFVYANELVAKVLGTSFTIRSTNGERQAQVIVRTGKVSVFSRSEKSDAESIPKADLKGVVLTANQQAVFFRQEGYFQKALVEKPIRLNPTVTPSPKQYEETPLTRVFGQLEKEYGIEIIYDEAALKNCTLTATLDESDLYTKLNLICRAIDATYNIVDAQIVVNARSCT